MLTNTRQDAWTLEEDDLLANTLLAYIQKGSTQLRAFEEIGIKLGRTAAACGFRWNNTLRKKYGQELQEAKRLYRHSKLRAVNVPNAAAHTVIIDSKDESLREVVDILRRSANQSQKVRVLEEQFLKLQAEYKAIQDDFERIQSELNDANEQSGEYYMLLRIINQTQQDYEIGY
ncbi:RsfA family transcriptional regulator [Brevibacillus sp. NPDC003359]|uniref:RsfA family transcriptional regulator n=1 Tax=unclassified Brevibacillus TaxID=2684853 RepID=UPI0036C60906